MMWFFLAAQIATASPLKCAAALTANPRYRIATFSTPTGEVLAAYRNPAGYLRVDDLLNKRVLWQSPKPLAVNDIVTLTGNETTIARMPPQAVHEERDQIEIETIQLNTGDARTRYVNGDSYFALSEHERLPSGREYFVLRGPELAQKIVDDQNTTLTLETKC